MRVWFDTEFIDDGRTIDLISIGMVRDDGREFYAENADCDRSKASAWVTANVLPLLTGASTPRTVIAREIVRFAGPAPEFWAYYASYDWVALCQLYGPMMALPQGWPRFCLDLRQEMHSRGLSGPAIAEDDNHNALSDARWNRLAWQAMFARGTHG